MRSFSVALRADHMSTNFLQRFISSSFSLTPTLPSSFGVMSEFFISRPLCFVPLALFHQLKTAHAVAALYSETARQIGP